MRRKGFQTVVGKIFRSTRNGEDKFKILLLGDTGVGKTSLINRYIRSHFSKEQMMTIGVDYSTTNITVNGQVLKLDVYDLAGQETFQIRKKVIKNIDGAIVVFDLTRHETFFSLRSWIDEIYETNPKTKIPLIIIGNKVDLRRNRAISKDEAITFVKSLEDDKTVSAKNIFYIETSAKTGKNTDKAFETLAKLIIGNFV